jgi:hypothetical protein
VEVVCARKRREEGGKEREKEEQENAGERRGEREEIKGECDDNGSKYRPIVYQSVLVDGSFQRSYCLYHHRAHITAITA